MTGVAFLRSMGILARNVQASAW